MSLGQMFSVSFAIQSFGGVLTDIDFYFTKAVVAVVIVVAILVLTRTIVIYSDLNPFNRIVYRVRQVTDPLVNPIKRKVMLAGLDGKLAPLVTILVWCLFGYILVSLVGSLLMAAKGAVSSVAAATPAPLFGFLIFGLLGVFSLAIFTRIVLSWGASSVNRLYLFLCRITDPILVPLRRLIPPVGAFDISPIVAMIVINLFQSVVARTLLPT